MARGNGTRKMMSNDDVSKLIRGDKEALGQVAKKGDALKVSPVLEPMNG